MAAAPLILAQVSADLNRYLEQLRACTLCAGDMPRSPNPIVRAARGAKILIASQDHENLANLSTRPYAAPITSAVIALLARLQPLLDNTTKITNKAIKTIKLSTILFFLTNQTNRQYTPNKVF